MILDLGCGTGIEARELAKRVAPQGKVIGLDTSAAMVAEASKRAHNLGLALEFQIGDAADLPFPMACFRVAERSASSSILAIRTASFPRWFALVAAVGKWL